MEYKEETGMRTSGKGLPKSYVSVVLLITLACVSHLSQAQKIWVDRTGCALGQGDLAPGYMFSERRATAYVDGDVALFLQNQFAVEGAIWVSFATAAQGPTGVKINEALFWGAEYHFLKPHRFDPFISFTPGVGLVQVAYYSDGEVRHTPVNAVPLASASIGCNYYVGSIFHFFIKVQGVVGQVSSTLASTQRLDELKFSGGLAFDVRLWKSKKYKPKT